METGQLEHMQGFEELTTRNVRAAVDHSNATRKLIRDLEEKVKSLDGEVRTYQSTIDLMKSQITAIQAKMYASGT